MAHRRGRRLVAALCTATAVASLAACGPAHPPATREAGPPISRFFASATVEDAPSATSDSDGDLWASCWADDGALYAANGDGSAFGVPAFDVAVSRIEGAAEDLRGTTLAGGDEVGQVWSGGGFTRKPTGMLCRDGKLYLAVQDLRKDFNVAPAATIAASEDHGRTWTWDREGPMFEKAFTTVMFLDYGKDAEHAPDRFVYAYGIDGNWRDSFDDSVPDPQDLYLARVPANAVQDRGAWRFYSGEQGGKPAWSADIADRRAVLHDGRRRYPSEESGAAGQTVGASNLSVISQGGVVYDAPLRRYLYTSWTEFTYEFYESPTPWGPWRRFLSRDFGRYPWTDGSHGGYGTTIPSKFISADGRTAWVQSNVCPCADAGTAEYDFNLRRLTLVPR